MLAETGTVLFGLLGIIGALTVGAIVVFFCALTVSPDGTIPKPPKQDCDCHWREPYGFVPDADCPIHDRKQ